MTERIVRTSTIADGVTLAADPDSPAPPFAQLRAQVVEAVRAGTLPTGTRLPTVRALAGDLGLAANTVARAYRELEAAGVIETRGRNGTFVGAGGDAVRRAASEAASAFAARAAELGVPPVEALALVRAALDARTPPGSAPGSGPASGPGPGPASAPASGPASGPASAPASAAS